MTMDADETVLRSMYDGLLAAWAANSAEDYAAFFTEDAQYIIASGAIESGRSEIIAGHQEIFTTWARGTTLKGELLGIRDIAAGVKVLTAQGGVIDAGADDTDESTVYTLLAVRRGEGWAFAGYQNTPVVSYGAGGDDGGWPGAQSDGTATAP